jgi:glycerol-3-phosphate dehydrogenase
LLNARPGEPSARSREYRIWDGATGLLNVAGGKYTTYRAMAQAITDRVLHRLGRRALCRTANLPLAGAWAPQGESAYGTLAARLQARNLSSWLLFRYGTGAVQVADYLQAHPDGALPVIEGEPVLYGELAYQRDHEMAVTLADHFLRRTRLGLFRPEVLNLPFPWLKRPPGATAA